MRFVLNTLVLIVVLGALSLFVLNDTVTFPMEMPASDSVVLVPAAANNPRPTTAPPFTQVDRGDDPEMPLFCTTAPNDCSLRAALEMANRENDETIVTFSDHFMITLARPLPQLTTANTIIRANPGQEIFINGNNILAPVISISGSHVTLEGLHIYGAGHGYPNVAIGGSAFDVRIANNIIGDDDAPLDNCGQNNEAYAGISISSRVEDPTAIHAYIYGNIIECHTGNPGVGILIGTDRVVVGHGGEGCSNNTMGNVVRGNRGYGIDIGNHASNEICHNNLLQNQAGNLNLSNYNNNLLNNYVE